MSKKADTDSFCHDLLSEKQLKLHASLPEGVLATLVNIFTTDTPEVISSMKQALKENDFKNLEAIAHGLKGSALTIGAKTVPEICVKIQKCATERNAVQSYPLLDELEKCFYKTCKQFDVFLKNY